MKVLVVEPMKECYTKEINGLEEMQALVGGYIQAIYPFPDTVPDRAVTGHWTGICGYGYSLSPPTFPASTML